MNSSPKISVVLPVYNGEEFICDAIESVLSQGFSDFELLVLNDGSTDNTHSKVQSFLSDGRVRYFSRPNLGLGGTLNELVQRSTSSLIARMDADDICLPDRLALQFELMSSRPDVVMCGADISFLVDGNVTPSMGVIVESELIKKALNQGRFPLCHPTVMFRKEVFDQVGGYRIQQGGEDLDLFLRFSDLGELANVDQVLLKYRIHGASLSMKKSDQLVFGYSYALDCAKRRKIGEKELSVQLFSEIYRKQKFQRGLLLLKYTISEKYYRNAIMARSRNQHFRYFCFGLATALLRPRASIERMCSFHFLKNSEGRSISTWPFK